MIGTQDVTFSSTIAIFVILTLLAWTLGLPSFIMPAEAAALSFFSDTISDSAPGIGVNHTFVATTTNGMIEGKTLTITFPSGFGLGSIDEDDVDIATSTEITTAGDCLGGEQMGVGIAGQEITFTACSGDFGEIASSSRFEIEIGNHAAASGSGDAQITNHSSTGSYEITIGGTMADSGNTRIVILTAVTVTASVDTIFQFQVNGVAASTTVNADTATVTTALTTGTTLPFGTLDAGVEYLLAQNLTVQTNAANGFTVTVRSDGPLDSATGADIDLFANGGASSTPAVWSSPVGYLNQENTWGHFGITSEDNSLSTTTDAGDPFGDAEYAGNIDQTDLEVFYHTGPSNGTTDHIGSTTIGYKLEITGLQEAADDYTATLTYIATPTF